MPYSPSFVMRQMARGKQFPTGSPEDHLWQAARGLDVWELREAWGMGASPHTRNPKNGLSILATLTEEARWARNDRAIVAMRDAWRAGARLGMQEKDVCAFHQWLTWRDPTWVAFLLQQPTLPWDATNPETGQTALHVLAEHADDSVWTTALRVAPVAAQAWERRDHSGQIPNERRKFQTAPERRPRP